MVEKVYRAAGRETGYWAGYFLRSVKQHGGVGAARRLLERGGVSKGLARLASLNRLDLAMETLVLDPAYRPAVHRRGTRDRDAGVCEEARGAMARAPGRSHGGLRAPPLSRRARSEPPRHSRGGARLRALGGELLGQHVGEPRVTARGRCRAAPRCG